jgi:hypothetical protein
MPRRVATPETGTEFNRRYATRVAMTLSPALKRRAKLIPTYASKTLDQASFNRSRRLFDAKLIGLQLTPYPQCK